jgi:peptidyl-tRNA hydrolase, PTH1 family
MVSGLGNPGSKYERTRHNVGFLVVDELARRLHIENWKTKDGVPIRILASWYRTPPEALLVVYDDMDLAFGRIRMKPFGGHGGHNGMRSVIATMGDRFPRIRVGLGRPVLQDQDDVAIDHVLSPFTPQENERLPEIIDAAVRGAQLWLDEGIESAMQFLNNLQIA